METDLREALGRLQRLHPVKIDLSLERILGLLGRLGDPQDRLPPVIHVAGTNGKGSTVAYLRAMLEAAGHRCHVYTSPHLIRFNERILLAGKAIEDRQLLDLIEEIERVNDGAPITFFEITTAMAFMAFARVPADVLLLEVGLGGRLDATNVIRNPLLSIITTISCDHCDWLGHTLPEIAAEKAGIMKPGIPCIIGHQMEWGKDEVMPVFRAQAEKQNANLVCCSEDWHVESNGPGITFKFLGKTLALPAPNLPGEHQTWNAGAAIAALLTQDRLAISDAAIADGITKAVWPARMEHITAGALAAALPSGWELWYDGGHNDSGGEVVGAHLKRWKAEEGKQVHLVLGMLETKSPEAFLKPVFPLIDSLSVFSFPTGTFSETGKAYGAAELAAKIRPLTGNVHPYDTLADAVQSIPFQHPVPGRILVTGTLYAYKDIF